MTIPVDALKTPKISSTSRSAQLSLARVLACLAIVTLHTVFAANEYFLDTVSGTENLISRAVENNMMWAVPVFLMVTGALQLKTDKKLSLKKLYGRYIFRVGMALIVFSVLFRLFDVIMDGEKLTLSNVLLKAAAELITGRGWGHLWYLYLLIGLYVMLPFYRLIVRHSSERELAYLAGVLFFFLSVIPCIEGFGVNINFYISESLIYPLYLLAGHALYEGRFRLSSAAAAAMAVLPTIGIVVLDILKYGRDIEIPGVLFGYSSPLVVLQAAGVFALILRWSIRPEGRTGAAVFRIDGCTFGIYLISMLFVRLIFRYMKFNPYDMMPALTLAACTAGIFLLSWAATACLKLIPGFRKIL